MRASQSGRVALVGLGGVGKSQIAIQYCHNIQAASQQTWLFWVNASTRARFEEAYRSIADRLKLPNRDDPRFNILRLVRDWLCDMANSQWIIVLDNADDIEVFYPKPTRERFASDDVAAPLATFLPSSPKGCILVTSRSKDAAVRLVASSKNIKEVQAMEREQAMQLLRNKLDDTSDEGGMGDLVSALDCIPLALGQATAYINQSARMTISRYLVSYWQNDRNKSNLLDRDAGDLRRDERASNSIVTTWEMSFEQIRKERSSAADLLSLMSFFSPQGIPESVLRGHSTVPMAAATSGSATVDEDVDFDGDLDKLMAYSLVKAPADGDICEMHPLVQFCTRQWLSSSNEVQWWRKKFVKLMAKEFPEGDFLNWKKCQMLLPHVEPLLEYEPTEKDMLRDWTSVANNAAVYWWLHGQYERAESLMIRAIKAAESIEGRAQPHVLDSLSLLGLIIAEQGRFEEAERTLRRALEGCKKVFGKQHTETLVAVHNLGLALESQGKYQEAAKMQRQALKGCDQLLGKEHPYTLGSLVSLGVLLQHLGKTSEAERMIRQALEGQEKLLGKDNPITLHSVDKLGLVLHDQRKYDQAEDLHQRALEGLEKTLGKEHPRTLFSLHNLGTVLLDQGRYEEAEEINLQAIEGFEKALGKEHPETLDSVHCLAVLLVGCGRYQESLPLFRRASCGLHKTLGPDHPRTLACLQNQSAALQHFLRTQIPYKDGRELGEPYAGSLHLRHVATSVSRPGLISAARWWRLLKENSTT